MDRRFVIQFHDAPDGPHYDLMLECEDALATWRLEALPCRAKEAGAMPAEKLPDHRRAYLDYEGPVSGGRGSVRIVEAGTLVLREAGPERWRVELAGQAVRGRFTLTRLCGARWELAWPERPAGSTGSAGLGGSGSS